MMATVVRMPEVITGITEAAVQNWLVSEGQAVEVGTPLAEIETEKAVIEYAAELAGTVLKLVATAGVSVSIGDPIVVIGQPGESVEGVVAAGGSGAAAEAAAPTEAAAPADPVNVESTLADKTDSASSALEAVPADAMPTEVPGGKVTAHDSGSRRFMSPLVRRLAKERGVNLDALVGSGPNGRIVRRDLDALETPVSTSRSGAVSTPSSGATAATETGTSPAPDPKRSLVSEPDATVQFDEIPLTRMRKVIARRLTEAKSTVPHFYVVAHCRVDELLTLRAQINAAQEAKVSVNDFVLKAVAGAMREVPEANSTWAETAIRRHRSVDIAVAVAIDGGLVVPVVRDVDQLTLTQIGATVADLAGRARAGKLTPAEMEGGSFSVSNLGMYGTAEFSAIINPPHAGILAVGAARKIPVVEDGALAVGTVMTVTLSADHRVLDGAVAAQWLAAFQRRIEHPLSMLV